MGFKSYRSSNQFPYFKIRRSRSERINMMNLSFRVSSSLEQAPAALKRNLWCICWSPAHLPRHADLPKPFSERVVMEGGWRTTKKWPCSSGTMGRTPSSCSRGVSTRASTRLNKYPQGATLSLIWSRSEVICQVWAPSPPEGGQGKPSPEQPAFIACHSGHVYSVQHSEQNPEWRACGSEDFLGLLQEMQEHVHSEDRPLHSLPSGNPGIYSIL